MLFAASASAKVWLLPDYQQQQIFSHRVNGGVETPPVQPETTVDCRRYGMIPASEVSDGMSCSSSTQILETICYGGCSCSAAYSQTSSSCRSEGKIPAGSSCMGEYFTDCICDTSLYPHTSSSCAYTPGGASCSDDDGKHFAECKNPCDGLTDNETDLGCEKYYDNCPSLCELGKTCVPNDCSEYDLAECPAGDDCYSCTIGCGNETTRYICAENYCGAYTLDSCPDNAVCSSCSPGCGDYNTYYRITGCPDGTFNMGGSCAPVAGEIAFTIVAEKGDVLKLHVNMWDGLDEEWDVFAIDWGDGHSMKETPAASTEHTYSAGTYDVVLTGNISHFQIDGHDTTVRLAKIDSLDLETVINYNDAFYDNSYFCKEATGSIPKPPDGLQRAAWMFGLCEKLTGEIPELPGGLTDASRMFYACKGLTGGIPALPDSLVSVENMFESCSGLDGSITNLPVGIKGGDSMFRFCTNLSGEVPQLPDGLTRGYRMFHGCQSLSGGIPELPASLQNGEWMFYGCSGLGGETPAKPVKLTNYKEMFYGTQVNLGSDWPSSAK